MEVYLILIHIVLFSSDNIEAGDILVNKKEVENIQTNYMLFLHRSLINNIHPPWLIFVNIFSD